MTEYSDVPKANALYQESERVASAIAMIDAGGPLSSFTITPAPAEGGAPPVQMMMPVSITVPPGSLSDPALMADLRAWLVTYQGQLYSQLAELEVTNPPAKASATR